MIYLLSEDFKNSDESICGWYYLLDEDRRSKVDRYRFPKDKALGTFAYILLRYALKMEYGIQEKPKLIYDRSGKPYIDGTDICFNLSHCDNAVACAVDRDAVGIDVQNYTEILTQIKKQFLTEKEMRDLGEPTDCRKYVRTLARIWTLKEAYGKYYGNGLIYDIREKDFLNVENSRKWQQYEDLRVYSQEMENDALSVFSKNDLDVHKVSFEDLSMLLYLQNEKPEQLPK